jgi:hypothetical protein
MPLSIPGLSPPLGGVSACANGVVLADHPGLAASFPVEAAEEIAELANGDYLRLLRERFEDGKCHFHLDLFAKAIIDSAEVNSTLEKITDKFDKAVLGKTLSVNFHSRFRLETPSEAQRKLMPFMGNVGINFAGTSGTFSSATLRLADSVFREISWKKSKPQGNRSARFEIELKGTLGPTSVSPDIFEIVQSRALDGFNRFILSPETAQATIAIKQK